MAEDRQLDQEMDMERMIVPVLLTCVLAVSCAYSVVLVVGAYTIARLMVP